MTVPDALKILLADQQLIYLVSLIGASLLIGIGSSLYTKTFQLANVADFVEHQLVPIVLGYLTAELLGWGNPLLVPVKDVVFTALCLRLLASITSNLAAMGIQLPSMLTQQNKPVVPVAIVSSPVATVTPRDVVAAQIFTNAGARDVRIISSTRPKIDTPSYGDSA